MAELAATGPINTDDGADEVIAACLNPASLRSFFLYAGAGSGKTRSLVNALRRFRDDYGESFRRQGRRVAIITFTNAACDEIVSRVGTDLIFPISTIHSFCWSQIGGFNRDIQQWLLTTLPVERAELIGKQARGRPTSQASRDRAREIEAIERRLDRLSVPIAFTYNPNGDNFGIDSLSHAEVIKMMAAFVVTKPSLQASLLNKFPILLIDESQDTSKPLMEALLQFEAANRGKFALGLIGDTMQRIYLDGKPDLGEAVPEHWARPSKQLNHRSARRIVTLGNALRRGVDEHFQLARDDKPAGVVRMFAAASTSDRAKTERIVRERMADISRDGSWTSPAGLVKTLTLEHHMAAERSGFLPMFQALDQASSLASGLRKGELSGVRLFSERVAPVVAAWEARDGFRVLAHLRRSISPLLRPEAMAACRDPSRPLLEAKEAVEALCCLNLAAAVTTFLDVLTCVHRHRLFDIPASLARFVAGSDIEAEAPRTDHANQNAEQLDVNEEPTSTSAWRAFLETPYRQILPYIEYVGDKGPFGTHQGVKGRQYDRVLVVIDDVQKRGFTFSYDKLFAEDAGPSVDHTRRLLYVTCTRAIESLALVIYTDDAAKVGVNARSGGWLYDDEFVELG